MIRLFLPILALGAAIWASRVVNPSELGARYERIERWLGRFGSIAAAVITIAAVWFTWGSLVPTAIAYDESSYLLQADIFAHGSWTAPSPAIPEFFEQPQVLVVPSVASRFPPGHAMVLAIGSLLRFPPLIPLLVAGLTAALIVMVGSRLMHPWMAILAWLIWLTTPMVLRYQGGYFAEPTATLAILAAWFCLLQWRETRQHRWAAYMAVAAGWGGITEPITMLAFGIPLFAVVVVEAVRGRQWPGSLIAVAVATAVLAIVPLWNLQTTGDPKLTPGALYVRDYVPFDRPGFTMGDTVPKRALTPVLESVRDDLLMRHEALEPGRLPRTLGRRMGEIANDLWQGAHLALLPFFVVGLFAMNTALRMGMVSALLLLLGRIPYAQDGTWTLPYLPIAPVVAAVTAAGLWRVLTWAANGVVVRLHIERRPKLGSALVALVLAFFALPTFGAWRVRHLQAGSMRAAFDDAMRQLPSSKSVIFLRYAPPPRHQHLSLVFNYPDLQREPVWVVHDLGERNQELLTMAQDRTAYVFDERTMEFKRF